MASDDAPPAAPHRRSTGRRIATWLIGGLAGLLLIGAALVFGLDTGPGHAFIARQLAGFETESGIKVAVDRIDGSIYGRMQLVGLKASDQKGVFLEAPAIDMDWRPLAYLNNLVDIRSLTAAEVRLLRMPALKPTDPNAPWLPDLNVTVGRFAVDRLAIAPAVTGKRHLVRIAGNADIKDGSARVFADARATVAPGIAGGDVALVRLDAAPDRNRLQIDAGLTAPAGGLVDSFAGLGRPLMFKIAGRGDWAAWAGTAAGQIGGQPFADLKLAARDGTFAARGTLQPQRLTETPGMKPEEAAQSPLAHLMAPALSLDAVAALANRRADLHLSARSDALTVAAKGLIDLGANRFGDLRLAAALVKPGAIAPSLTGRDVHLAAVLNGPFATPTVAYRLNAAALAFGATGVTGLAAQGRATVDADRILIPVAATAERVTGLNAAAGGLLERLSLNGDLAWSNGRILSDNLALKSSKIDATALVLADIANGRYTGAIKGRINDYRVAGLGRLSVATDAELVPGKTGGFGIRGSARVTTRRIENEALASALGGDAVTIARFGLDEHGVASLAGLRLTSPGFTIRDAKGSYALDSGRIDFTADAVSRDYGPLLLKASGSLERPQVNLRAARPGLGVGLRDVEARLTGVAAGYAVVGRGQSDYGPVSADMTVRTGKVLVLDIARATFAGVDLNGSIQQTPAGPFSGRLTLAGAGINGGVALSAAGANQRADVDVTANAATIPATVPITIGSGRLRATATVLPEGPAVDGAFRLANLRQGDILVEKAQGKIDYQRGAGKLALVATGHSGMPFDIAGQAALTPTRLVANLRGHVSRIAFNLDRPAVVTKNGGDWTLQPATLVVPQGKVEFSGRYGATTEVHARLANMDVAIVQAVMPGLGLGGRASGTIDYASSGPTPTMRARLDIAGLTRTAAYVVSEPVDVAMLGTLGDGGGDVRALIRRGGANVGRMQARLAPLGAGAGLSERLFAAPLSGGIRYNGPADVLWTMTGIAGQTISGPIALAADFGGRLDQPTITGLLRGKGLRYQNETFGTLISGIALDGRFTQSRLEIASFNGKAGTGTVAARGTIGFDAASGFPIDLTATLDRAQLARSDALGATATGTISVTNGPDGGLIKGDIRIPEARYAIVRQGAAEVADLEGVRRRTDKPMPPGTQVASPFSAKWKLDIALRADNQIFVSGMGLEAEWAAKLRVTGTAADPRIVGTLGVVRGTYSFGGRRLELDDKGEVRFDGGSATNPQLSLAASTTVEGVSAIVNIGGRAFSPEIRFTSTPALPQDEVLARLLFGESVTSLSPMQAVQLAAALNSLRNPGGGLNPLGKLRSATGIDRLRVLGADKTAGRGTAIAAGQYISKNIYVEVITDARGFTATQLEISLSKTLSLLSQTASFGGSSASLRYSKDY